MQTLRLRAADEATLAAALPMLRGADDEGAPCWVTSGPLCEVRIIGALPLTAPVVNDVLEIVEPATFAEGWHLNVRGPRIGADPAAWAELLEAAAPYTLTEIALPRERFLP